MSDGTKRLIIATVVTIGLAHIIMMLAFTYQWAPVITLLNLVGITAEPTYASWFDKTKLFLSIAGLILAYTHIAAVSPYKGVPGRLLSAGMTLTFIGVTCAMINKSTVTLGEKVSEYMRFFGLPMLVSLPVLIAIGGVSIHHGGGKNMGITDPLQNGS